MDQLKPGPELNKLVALALGGEKLVALALSGEYDRLTGLWDIPGWGLVGDFPPFSTDPGEAIKALEAFCSKDMDAAYGHKVKSGWSYCHIFECEATPGAPLIAMEEDRIGLAHAICLAIVEAAGGER